MSLLGEQILLRVYLHSADRAPFTPTHELIVQEARRRKLAGATVIRGILGAGHRGILQSSTWSITEHVPVIVEIVDSAETIAAFVGESLDKIMVGGMATLERAAVMMYRHRDQEQSPPLRLANVLQPLSTVPKIQPGNHMTQSENGVLLRVFLGESDRYENKPLYEAIVQKVRELGIAGATVLRGSSGFGARSVVHKSALLEMSSDLPIVIEIVDAQEKVNLLLPHLETMVREGMITMEHVVVLLYRDKKSAVCEQLMTDVWDDTLLANPHAVTDKRRRVQAMFAAIAPSYDLNNRLHSLWMDQAWRRKAVKLADLKPSDHVVDVACGTGDLTLAFSNGLGQAEPVSGQVVGIDFTYEMLPIAVAKWERSASSHHRRLESVRFINGDAQSLPLPDACCDVVSIAFGIRNVADPAVAIREFFRVLRPGGRLIILEFSLPTNAILRGMYNFYFKQILPRTATLISGDKTGAYKYLPQSVNTFIGRETMSKMMAEAGFGDVVQHPMTFGICVCYRGIKGALPAARIA